MQRKTVFGALSLVLFTTWSCQANPFGVAADSAYDAETFFATTSMYGASFSFRGDELLVTSDESGIYNVYSVDLGSGELTQLTHSRTNAIFALGWFRTDDRFLYSSDEGGNELTHIFVREPDGDEIDLTPGENLKAGFVRWADDGRSFFATTNERNPQYFDLYRVRVASNVREASTGPDAAYDKSLLFANPGGYDLSDVSRDGRWVALTKVRNNADSDVYIVDLHDADGEPIHVTPHEGDIEHSVETFAPDGSKLYYTSNEGSEFDRVLSYDLATGEREVVFEADWDVIFYLFSRDGRYVITGVNADAQTVVRLFEAATGKEISLPEIPGGDVRGISIENGGDRMAFYVNGDSSPSNLYLLDLSTMEYERMTDTLNPEIDPAALVESVVVRYPSFDGLGIPALLYKPHGASPLEPAPAVVLVHGGPGGQSRKGYRPDVQHLVNHGYAVLAVNNRGSSGYGKTFHHMDDRRHGDVDLKDCIWGRRFLESLDWVDGDRVAIMGGSYGGYMVCAALAFEPDAFDAGIDIFGVTNWLRTLKSIPPWWADFRDALYAEMGDPATDHDRLHASSPLFHAKNITKPLLVVQGANDPRVLQAESDEMVEAVRANGVPVEYILFEDEGHGFRVKENRIEASDAYVEFLNKYLRGAPAN